jgi:GAF domain-containing protein
LSGGGRKGQGREFSSDLILSEAVAKIRAAPDDEAAYDAAWHASIRLGECDSFVISRFDAEAGTIHAVYGRHYAGRIPTARLPPLPLDPPGRGTQSRVIQEGRAILFDDFRSAWTTSKTRYVVDEGNDVRSVPEAPAPEDADVPPSAIMAPLRDGARTVGVVALYSTSRSAYGPEDLEVLQGIADLLSKRRRAPS